MLRREPDEEVAPRIVESRSEVEGVARQVRRREGRVRAVRQVGIAAAELLREQVGSEADGERAAPELEVIGILQKSFCEKSPKTSLTNAAPTPWRVFPILKAISTPA